MTSTTPNSNSGSAARTSSRFELRVSKIFSRRNAAQEPIAIDSGIETIAEMATSTAEFTSLGANSVVTGSWAASEVPRLPRSSPVNQVQYWVKTGWSRCSFSRSAARLCGVADRPKMARAGSPGSAWVAAKTTIDTMNRTMRPSSSRRTMNPETPPDRNLASTAVGLTEPDRAEPVAEAIQVERALAGLQTLYLVRVAVDQVAEERNDVAADVVFEFLHLMLDLDPLTDVRFRQGLFIQRDEVRSRAGLRWPVRLVVRTVRQ